MQKLVCDLLRSLSRGPRVARAGVTPVASLLCYMEIRPRSLQSILTCKWVIKKKKKKKKKHSDECFISRFYFDLFHLLDKKLENASSFKEERYSVCVEMTQRNDGHRGICLA